MVIVATTDSLDRDNRIRRESETQTDALQSSALAGTLQIDQNSLSGLNLVENNQEPTDFYEDIQNIGPDNLRFLAITPQVASLLEYLQTGDYKRKKLKEEKNWGEVFDSMFSWFHQCSAKTSNWGDKSCWNRDWKEACNCNNTQLRRVALVDISSKVGRRWRSCFVDVNWTRFDLSKWVILVVPQNSQRQLFLFDSYISTI
ncbi:hypothetical protein MJO28_009365 [Puccinia striiformis f. sp. tritici]|uniref:Uncharacterized protein n=1 Tax=Puccinia striiformis f. sp. tritici TaxID=168172 RepID=A0ACC0E7G1_9BASI|nr:hypothetical protein MJO28_009365 [Puccinia striiformis f. sp. tritici]